jgi:hypothetical protein
MAIWFSGKSECSICGAVLEAKQDVIGHPAILFPDHPLWRFSDSAMHRACYEQWEHHEYFESILRKYKQLWESRPTYLRHLPDEFRTLPKEDRERISREIDQWSAQTGRKMREFLQSIGPPKMRSA